MVNADAKTPTAGVGGVPFRLEPRPRHPTAEVFHRATSAQFQSHPWVLASYFSSRGLSLYSRSGCLERVGRIGEASDECRFTVLGSNSFWIIGLTDSGHWHQPGVKYLQRVAPGLKRMSDSRSSIIKPVAQTRWFGNAGVTQRQPTSGFHFQAIKTSTYLGTYCLISTVYEK